MTAWEQVKGRKQRLWVVLGAVFCLGAAGMYTVGQRHAGPVLWPDACGYLSAARVLRSHGVFGYSLIQLNSLTLREAPELDRVGWWPPVYPAIIALAAGSRIDDPEALIATAHLVDLVGVLLGAVGFGLLGYLVTDSLAAGLLCCGLCLLSGPFPSEANRLLSEHVYIAFVGWAVAAHLWVVRRGSWWAAVAAGLLWGLACLTRHWGIVPLFCAAFTACLATRKAPGRRLLLSALVVPAIALTPWLGWAVRCILAGGQLSTYVTPGVLTFGEELLNFAGGYFFGFCANPFAVGGASIMASPLAFIGAVTLALLLGSMMYLLWSSKLGGRTWEPWAWMAMFGLCVCSATVVGMAAYRAKHLINAPTGRLLMDAVALTVVALVTTAVTHRKLRPLMALLGVCVVVGGVQQNLSNLLLPTGWEQLESCHILAKHDRLQDLVRDRKVLLLSRAGVRGVPDLVPACTFLPTASTIYWPDNPLYAGMVVGGPEISALIRRAHIPFILAGPDYLFSVTDNAGDADRNLFGRRRAQLIEDILEKEHRAARHLARFMTPLETPVRCVLKVGEWELWECLPEAEE